MTRTKITKLQRLHVDVAATVGIADPARSGTTFIVLDGDLTTALDTVRAATLEHRGRLDTAQRRGLRTIERRLEQAKPAYVTVTNTATADESAEQADKPAGEPVAPSEEVLAAVAETGAVHADAPHAAAQHADAPAPTIDELRAMDFAERRARVVGMNPDARVGLLAAMGRDEIESFLDAAVIGIGVNNDIDTTFRAQILHRYDEIDPDAAAAARAAAANYPVPVVDPVVEELADVEESDGEQTDAVTAAEPSTPPSYGRDRGTMKRLGIAVGDNAEVILGPVDAAPPNPAVTVRPTRYTVTCLPETIGSSHAWAITVEYRGRDRWAVVHAGDAIAADGGWDADLRAHDTDDAWLAAHRFDLDTAVQLARQAAPTIEVNGHTPADVLARHRTRHRDR